MYLLVLFQSRQRVSVYCKFDHNNNNNKITDIQYCIAILTYPLHVFNEYSDFLIYVLDERMGLQRYTVFFLLLLKNIDCIIEAVRTSKNKIFSGKIMTISQVFIPLMSF